MKLADFSPEAQELLKGASFHDLKGLGAEANGIKDRERMAKLGSDPGETVKAVFELRKPEISITVDDPLDFIDAAIEAAREILGHEMEQDPTHHAAWEMLTAGQDVLGEYRRRDREVQDRLRAAFLKQRDAEAGK